MAKTINIKLLKFDSLIETKVVKRALQKFLEVSPRNSKEKKAALNIFRLVCAIETQMEEENII